MQKISAKIKNILQFNLSWEKGALAVLSTLFSKDKNGVQELYFFDRNRIFLKKKIGNV